MNTIRKKIAADERLRPRDAAAGTAGVNLRVSCYQGTEPSDDLPALSITVQEMNEIGALTTAFVQHRPGPDEPDFDAYYREAQRLDLRCVVAHGSRRLAILRLMRLGPVLYELTLRSESLVATD